jgi:WD40 repeat protein
MLRLSGDGRWLVAVRSDPLIGTYEESNSFKTHIQVWDLRHWPQVRPASDSKWAAWPFSRISRRGDEDVCISVGLSQDGELLAIGTNTGKVGVWSRSGRLIRWWWTGASSVNDLCFSPKGGRLATAGSDGSVRLWTFGGINKLVIQAHLGEQRSFAWGERGLAQGATLVGFSPDGTRIATAGVGGPVRLWDLAGNQLAEFVAYDVLRGERVPIRVASLSFSGDGSHLAVASFAGSIDVLRIDTLDGLLTRADARLHISDEELVRSLSNPWVAPALPARLKPRGAAGEAASPRRPAKRTWWSETPGPANPRPKTVISPPGQKERPRNSHLAPAPRAYRRRRAWTERNRGGVPSLPGRCALQHWGHGR